MSALKYTLVVRDPEGNAVALLAGKPVPSWAKSLVHADDLTDSDPDESDDTDGAETGYAAQTKADLQVEIDKRNEDREDENKIVPDGKGNKPDLVAALEADDAKLAAASDGADN